MISIFLLSCTSEQETESVVQESTQIVSDYTDALEWSISDARDTVNVMNARTDSIWK